jgi:hypothetical protein
MLFLVLAEKKNLFFVILSEEGHTGEHGAADK